MERALQRYLRYHRTQGSTDKTLEWHTRSIRTFIAYLQTNNLPTTLDEGLKLAHVRDWLDSLRERGQAQHTLATSAQSLKAFSRWLEFCSVFSDLFRGSCLLLPCRQRLVAPQGTVVGRGA
jgi:site-specific recombinase XerD